MRTLTEQRSLAAALTVGLVLWSLLLCGCHWPRRSARTGRPCPVCRKETRTLPLTSLTYTTCVCPACRTVTMLDVSTGAAVEAYTRAGVGDTVEVCSHCQIIAERCAVCREKQRR